MMTQPPHILIVDDHRDIRDALVKYLEKNGMRATSAADAVAMDAAMKVGQFDLIVLDVVRRRMIWNRPPNFGAEVLGSSGLCYAA